MSDRITTFEAELKDILLSVDGTIQPSGYQYYTDIKVVNVHDEALTIDNGGYPSVLIEMDPNETVLAGEANAYRNKITYKLTCRVENDNITQSPKFAINTEMNKVLSDIKYILSYNYHLNSTVDVVNILRSQRVYNTSNDLLRTGDLIIYITVTYTQSRLDPSRNVCA